MYQRLVCFVLISASLALAQATGVRPHCDLPIMESKKNTHLLLKLLDDNKMRVERPGCVNAAIILLGNMRATLAIKHLVPLLTFKRPADDLDAAADMGFVFREPSRPADYPAIGALFQIGEPALPALVNAIAEAGEVLAAENALYTLMTIFRQKPREGVEYLRRAAIAHEDAEAAARLHTAADKAARVWIR